MALKTDFKDDIFEGNRKYKLSQDGEGNTEIQDVTVYSQEGNLFTAEHINATNKAVNGLSEDMASLKKSVSDGKTLVAAAITAKKVATAATASFAEMLKISKRLCWGAEPREQRTYWPERHLQIMTVLNTRARCRNAGLEWKPGNVRFHNNSCRTSQRQGKVSAATQTALTLNPGTTQKTAYVYQKYMLGNITVPAINIPAAYIKKGQRITFPDGSSVVGTFEGWVPVATDLYYNGQNVAGFEPNNINTSDYASFDNNQISITGVTILKFKSTITYDVRSYSKFIIEGN